MAAEDPSIWKLVANNLWAVLTVPLGYVWLKATNAVGREELEKVAREARDERREIRDMVKTLFANAESDRATRAAADAKQMAELHKVHIDLINRIEKQVHNP